MHYNILKIDLYFFFICFVIAIAFIWHQNDKKWLHMWIIKAEKTFLHCNDQIWHEKMSCDLWRHNLVGLFHQKCQELYICCCTVIVYSIWLILIHNLATWSAKTKLPMRDTSKNLIFLKNEPKIHSDDFLPKMLLFQN